MSVTNQVKFGIRLKLFLVVLVSFGVLMSVIAWRISIQADFVAQTAIQDSKDQSEVILKSRLDSRYDAIFTTTKSIATDSRVLSLVVDRDQASLLDFIHELKTDAEFDLAFFTDENGVVLARSDKPQYAGIKLKGKSFLVDQTLSGVREQGIMLSSGRLYQVVGYPIFDNVVRGKIQGTVAVAYRLSSEIADNIKRLSKRDVGFYAFQRKQKNAPPEMVPLYFTNPSLSDDLNRVLLEFDPLSHIQGNNMDNIKQLKLNDEIFSTSFLPLEKSGGGVLGFVVTLRSETVLRKPFDSIIQQVIIIGGICLLLASIIAWVIASRISKPIIQLVDVTRSIEEGGYPTESDRYQAQDEVGMLYHAVFQMGRELKNKADLEGYLANISEGLEEEDMLTAPEDLSTINQIEAESELEKTLAAPYSNARNEQVTLNLGRVPSKPVTPGLEPGKIFANRYEIIRSVGAGSMGAVYVAKDVTLDEIVALKVLFSHQVQTENQETFKEEIRLARKITHRNILRTFDFGVYINEMYISMEYVHGRDLNALLKKTGCLDLNIGVMLARQICSAVSAAHNEGIIHRDLNPRNMMVNKQGILKVMDFGLAMRVGTANTSSQEQMIVGTPYYLAPEQILRDTLDIRTDIYAIGVILFKIFSGKTPYDGVNLAKVLQDHLSSPIPNLIDFAPDVPQALADISKKAMQKDKLDRFKSVSEIQIALQSLNI